MPAETPCVDIPYPLDTDPIDVAGDFLRLAERVDAVICAAQGDLTGKVSRGGDTMTGMLTLPGVNPTSDNHAVRKRWVDDFFVHVSGDTMTGNLQLPTTAPNTSTAATPRSYVDTRDNLLLPRDGSRPMTGQLTLASTDGTGSNMAMRREWINSNFVHITGDVLSGDLQVGTNANFHARLTDDGAIVGGYNGSGDSLNLRRGSSADAVGARFISFRRGGSSPGTLIGEVSIGPDQDHVRYLESSDYRLKESIGPIDDAAVRVQRLASRTFCGRWRKSGATADMVNAHDVAEIAPYAVKGDKDGEDMQMVSYGELVPLLFAALGSALDRLDDLEAVS
jgi:hypothetical protein